MAWSTPLTAVSNAVLTAAQWNESVRDNLLACAPAIAETAGRIVVTAGTNVVATRAATTQVLENAGSTSSTSYVDFDPLGPTVAIRTGGKAFVVIEAQAYVDTVNARPRIAIAIQGATTHAPTDNECLQYQSDVANQDLRGMVSNLFTVNPGVNRFTMRYRTTAGTATFWRRRIQVIGL